MAQGTIGASPGTKVMLLYVSLWGLEYKQKDISYPLSCCENRHMHMVPVSQEEASLEDERGHFLAASRASRCL